MDPKYTYLAVNFFSIFFPLIFSFHRKINFVKEWKYFFPACILTTVFFIAWDVLFTRMGVWGFNERYLTGVKWFGLPAEEVLFFICIPYASVFTYFVLSQTLLKNFKGKNYNNLFKVLLIVFLICGTINYKKLYPFITFTLLAIILFVHVYVLKSKYKATFFFSYLVILIPFFIVNGILTGTGIDEEVVWYNNDENLGIRILTIPIEDFFYGMLLILINLTVFEELKSARKTSANTPAEYSSDSQFG